MPGVDVVKIKELLECFDCDDDAEYPRDDQGKRGAIVALSEYQQRHCRKILAK